MEGNFIQLLKFLSIEDSELFEWIKKKSNKYTSPDIQNELIRLMATSILRDLSKLLQGSQFLSVMIDETTDVTNQEQVTIVMRRIDQCLEVHEEFLGLYSVPCIDAATLFSVIQDVMLRLNIPMNKLRGQCFDGCSTMSGSRSGVAKRVQEVESRAVFTHCYSHSLNLAVSDSCKKSQFMKSALEVTHEITKLIKLSPRRDSVFKELKADADSSEEGHSCSVKLLCPTRWTVRADALLSVLNNYKTIIETWDIVIDIARDTETKARIQGVHSQMETFNFLFGAFLGEMILRHTDNLSKTLQNQSCSAAEGQLIADMVVRTLSTLRSDESFDMFWSKLISKAELLDIQPELPRRRKRPATYEEGLAESEFHDNPKTFSRQHYFEGIDLAFTCIKDRFRQPGYEVYSRLETLLVGAAIGGNIEADLNFVCDFYKDDLEKDILEAQLVTFRLEFQRTNPSEKKPNIFEIKKFLCSLTNGQQALLSQVCVILKLILIMPATNATSERSFSALRRLKTYLRNTMTQQRLNNVMMLHVHKELTDEIDLGLIVTEFIGDSEHRQSIFGIV